MKRSLINESIKDPQDWSLIFCCNVILNNHLKHCLSPISLMALVRALPKIRTILDTSIYDIIISRCLARLPNGFHRRVFKYGIYEHNWALSGSFLLSVLMGSEWTGDCIVNDIDYITTEIQGPHWKFKNSNISQLIRRSYNMNCGYRFNPYLKKVYDVLSKNHDGLKVQILSVSNVQDYVDSFDLSFCRNYISSTQLIICCPNSIIKQTTSVSLNEYCPKMIMDPIYVYHTYLPARYQRLSRYVQRGFTINFDISYPWLETLQKRLHNAPCSESIIQDHISEDEIIQYKNVLAAYYYMFWTDRIDKQRHLVLGRYPEWKDGKKERTLDSRNH